MITKLYKKDTLKHYKYVIVLSEYRGRILLSRHRERTTWETQGGHIEPGETPADAAKRELYEESGAVEYEIIPLCDYWCGTEEAAAALESQPARDSRSLLPAGDSGQLSDDWANGMVFHARIRRLGPMPESKMAEVREFAELPANLTYPDITPVLFAYLNGQK